MDFLDPAKMRRHNIMLYIGYGLVAIAIAMAALILLYWSYGFGINRHGTVIQRGLVFTATRPSGATIYLNGKDTGYTTSKRLNPVAGDYLLELVRDGYRSWSRQIQVEGGSVNRFDYPVLFPDILETSDVAVYNGAVGLATQSPDRRWVVLARPGEPKVFDVYDLKDPTKAPVQITIPDGVLTAPKQSESWQLVEWSNDNKHVLLKHLYDTSYEYILLNRDAVAETINLTTRLGLNPTQLRLIDKKYDKYYLYDATAKTLQRASLTDLTPLDYLKNVLAFKSYSDNVMLYVSDDTQTTTPEDANKVAVKLLIADQTYAIRKLNPGATYTLELAKYADSTYVVAGSDTENAVYVYRNPVEQINDKDLGFAVPVSVLRVKAANYVAFSDNTRFIVAENGNEFGVYDAEEETSYKYILPEPLDAPQQHAEWMDGHRLEYVSGGKLVVFDYDHTNKQTLMAMSSTAEPFYTPDFKRVFALVPDQTDTTKVQLTQTWLLTKADR